MPSRIVHQPGEAAQYVQEIVRSTRSRVYQQALIRANMMGEVLEHTANRLLTGPRSGRIYRYAGQWYQASAPGELPAERTGGLRFGWRKILSETPTGEGTRIRVRLQSTQSYAVPVQRKRPYERAIALAARSELQAISRRRWLV
jgi:hypothetical protein